jgi:phage tail sheath protein FI
MPITPTYPGVYIEEIPSGVRTITGVATSITAFVGRASNGPVNDPVMINSFGDFERAFGGLRVTYPMSYAVRDFYLNGGSQAIIVRLFNPSYATEEEHREALDAAQDVANAATGADAAAAATAARTEADKDVNEEEPRKTGADTVAKEAEEAAATQGATPESVNEAAQEAASRFRGNAHLTVGPLKLQAASPGIWGNALRATLDPNASEDVAKRYGLTKQDLFNLTIRDIGTGTEEKFLNLSLKESPRRIDRVLEAGSNLVRWTGPYPAAALPGLPSQLTHDDISQKVKTLEDKEKALEEARKGTDADAIQAAEDQRDDAEKSLAAAQTAGAGSNGLPLDPLVYQGNRGNKTGLYALEKADLFNLLCIPPDSRDEDTDKGVYQDAMAYCRERRAMLIIDSPLDWGKDPLFASDAGEELDELGLAGDDARNAALYFPRVLQADPLRQGQIDTFVPCGIIAGVMARTDAQRGVWKAPAGLDASLNGIQGLQANLTDQENGRLNPLGINCLRSFPVVGRVSWGARTLRGADLLASEWKYVPVRRLALYIEESLYRGTQWVVFEPNDEPLWSQIRLNIGAFMQNLFRQGAFQGKTPQEAYFVKCDKETTTQNDINLGVVNIVVGFAPLKPAEFVIIRIQQMAGQVEA